MRKFVVLLILATCGEARAASFDCQRAATFVEKAICADAALSQMDSALAKEFQKALMRSTAAAEVRASQIAWMTQRNQCQTPACLEDSYRQRIDVLAAVTSTSPQHDGKRKLPKNEGECVDTRIAGKATRFEGATAGENGGEVNVQFDNGVGIYIGGVDGLSPSVNADKYMFNTRDFTVGDTVSLCLIALPTDCPPGDDRGKEYAATSYRNKKKFSGVDSWHLCGGA